MTARSIWPRRWPPCATDPRPPPVKPARSRPSVPGMTGIRGVIAGRGSGAGQGAADPRRPGQAGAPGLQACGRQGQARNDGRCCCRPVWGPRRVPSVRQRQVAVWQMGFVGHGRPKASGAGAFAPCRFGRLRRFAPIPQRKPAPAQALVATKGIARPRVSAGTSEVRAFSCGPFSGCLSRHCSRATTARRCPSRCPSRCAAVPGGNGGRR